MCYGVGWQLGGELPLDVLELIHGSRKVARDVQWKMKTEKRDAEVAREIPIR